jgi:hypothetical protein
MTEKGHRNSVYYIMGAIMAAMDKLGITSETAYDTYGTMDSNTVVLDNDHLDKLRTLMIRYVR